MTETLFRVVEIPPFDAITSGVDRDADFSEDGILGAFGRFFSALEVPDRDRFLPRDFLLHDPDQQGLVWWWALTPGQDRGGYGTVRHPGGWYLSYSYRDGDAATHNRLYREAKDYIATHPQLELSEGEGRYGMGHIVTPQDLIAAQGWAQMVVYVPVRLVEVAR